MTIKEEIEKIENQIDWLEDKQGFAPRALKERLWALRAELKKSEK